MFAVEIPAFREPADAPTPGPLADKQTGRLVTTGVTLGRRRR
ncbi:hypothetical protein [Streptosporangium carneum]|nr:hypothetical protein [Streptosporangium carneum]